MPGLIRATHDELVRLYAAGEIDPLIHETVPFKKLPEALELLGRRGTRDKLVSRPQR